MSEPTKPMFQYLSGYQLLRLLHELQGSAFRYRDIESVITRELGIRAELPPGYIPENNQKEKLNERLD